MSDKKVAWKANAGPQTEALRRVEFEVGFGGSRGGGKTDAGLAWLLYDSDHPKYKALVVRKNQVDLSDWLERATEFYKPYGVKRVGSTFKFPKGGIIKTGHLKDDNAFEKYQGHEYQKMLLEELTQIASENNYLKLLASCRSTVPGLTPQVFASFNPDGPGFFWVRKRFNIKGIPNSPSVTIDAKTGLSRVFIPSKLSDNPFLNQDPTYRAFLDGLPDGIREAWRDGSWSDPKIEGAYYTGDIQRAREEGRIGFIPYRADLPVHTVWDLGISDAMAILFFQKDSKGIYLIHAYSNEGLGLPHYISYLNRIAMERNYVFGKHYAPHDANKRELATGQTIIQSAEKLGIKFEQIPMLGIQDGIMKVRLVFSRLFINEQECEQALNAWLNYRKQWDEKNLRYKDDPIHDWSSHYADTLRYLAVIEDKITNEVKKKTTYVYEEKPLYGAIGI